MNGQSVEARIWIGAGVTDMRRGFQCLAAQVQTALEQQPYSGHIFIFRGRRRDMVKLLWFDGDGLCLFQKRLERGRIVWRKDPRSRMLGAYAAQVPRHLRRHRVIDRVRGRPAHRLALCRRKVGA